MLGNGGMMMSETKVGEVPHFYSRIFVAVLDLSKALRVGESIGIVLFHLSWTD